MDQVCFRCFTTKPQLPVLKKLRCFNAVLIEPTVEQDLSDITAYFTSSLPLNIHGSEEERKTMAETLAGQAEGNFLYASITARKYADYGTTSEYLCEGLTTKLGALLNLEYDALMALEAMNDDCLFWKVAKLAIVAMKPLHTDIIAALIGCDEEDLDRLFKEGSTFFATHDSCLQFRHKTMKEWLLRKLKPMCSEEAPQVTLSRRLSGGAEDQGGAGLQASTAEVAHCHNFFADRVVAVTNCQIAGSDWLHAIQSSVARLYLLEHAVQHLVLAKRIEQARGLILDPAWLVARAADPEFIVECCELVGGEDHILHLVGRTVSLAADSVRSDPRQLVGQLVGRLLAATTEGHGDHDDRAKLIDFVNQLRSFDYGYQWWCPVAPTWDQAHQPFLRKFLEHTEPVQSVAWHFDGRRFASSSWDATIRVWDSVTGCVENVYTGHTDSVFSVHWETNGNRFVSGSLDRLVKIWNTMTRECEATLRGHSDSVWCVQWSKDNKRIASGSKDKTVRIWCGETGDEISCLTNYAANGGAVYCVSWEGGIDSRLCTGGTDNLVRIWDTYTESCIQTVDGHTDWIRDVQWGQGGKILSASADHTVRVWSFTEDGTAKCQLGLMGHSDCCWSVSMSPDTHYAVSGSTDGTVKVWNLER